MGEFGGGGDWTGWWDAFCHILVNSEKFLLDSSNGNKILADYSNFKRIRSDFDKFRQIFASIFRYEKKSAKIQIC